VGGAHACEEGARTSAGGAHPCREDAHIYTCRARTPARWGARTSKGWARMVFSFFWVLIKLGIHASNVNSRFVIMSELELSFLMGVLAPYFNTMDLVKIIEKKQKFHIQIVAVTLKVMSCKTISKKKNEKK
jgi:hypothetical protein